MLKCTRKFVVSTASIKWTSDARLTSETAFETAAPVKRFSMIGGYAKKRTKKEMEKKEMERIGNGNGKQ